MIPGIKPCTGPGCELCKLSKPGEVNIPVQGLSAGDENEVTKKTSTAQTSKVTPGRTSPQSKKPPLVEKATKAIVSRSSYADESNSAESQHNFGSTPKIIQAKTTQVTRGHKKPGASGK